MRYLFLFMSFLFFLPTVSSQSKHELGIRATSFRDFGAIYKKQLKDENRYFRLRNTVANVNYGSISESTSVSVGFAMGFEKRKFFNASDALILGPELGVSLRFGSNSSVSHFYRLGYLIGMVHQFKSNFSLGFEFIPSVNFSGPFDNLNFDASLNFSTVGITLMYAFETKGKE